jgi:hypothetical protein
LGYVKQSMVRDDEPGRDRSKRLEKMEFHAGTRTTGGAGPNGASADWNPCFLSSAIADWGKVADQITSRLPLPKAMQQVRLNRRVGRFPVHNVQHLMVGRFRGVPLRHEIAFQAVFRPEQKPVAAERILKPPPEVFASVGRLLPFFVKDARRWRTLSNASAPLAHPSRPSWRDVTGSLFMRPGRAACEDRRCIGAPNRHCASPRIGTSEGSPTRHLNLRRTHAPRSPTPRNLKS